MQLNEPQNPLQISHLLRCAGWSIVEASNQLIRLVLRVSQRRCDFRSVFTGKTIQPNNRQGYTASSGFTTALNASEKVNHRMRPVTPTLRMRR